MGIQQGRLWAFRSGDGPIFHDANTLLPTLFRTRKSADDFNKRLKTASGDAAEVIEVEIIEKVAQKELYETIEGLMEIAEQAMPDSYFQSDSRVNKARKALAEKGA